MKKQRLSQLTAREHKDRMPILADEEVLVSAEDEPTAIMRLLQTWAASRSKDPRTKVAAAVQDPMTKALYMGYNGFPARFPDFAKIWENRDPAKQPNKYQFVRHAEANAISKAAMGMGRNIIGAPLYVTHLPCLPCLVNWILPFGINRVYYVDVYSAPAGEDAVLQEFMSGVGITAIRLPPPPRVV